jgi:holo-[acyl-carrier protein] synthase
VTALAVGIDLVSIEEVRASLAAHGERYLRRVYTEGERRGFRGDPRALAACFAAKEATAKALGWGDSMPFAWRSIAVERDAVGRPCVRLFGPALELAERRGVRRLDVSFTHRRAVAAAVVLAERG